MRVSVGQRLKLARLSTLWRRLHTTFAGAEKPETLGSAFDALVRYVRDTEQPFSAPKDSERISAGYGE